MRASIVSLMRDLNRDTMKLRNSHHTPRQWRRRR